MRHFTSDLHFGHERIIELSYRPFASVTDMNEALVRNWNERVLCTDTVYVLGDICMGQLVDSLAMVEQLNGRIILIPGNHDRVWMGYPHKREDRLYEFMDKYHDAGMSIADESVYLPQYMGKHTNVLMHHFPAHGDHTEQERYNEYRPDADSYDLLLHGHVHDTWKSRGNMVNVGVDVWDWAPVSEATLAAYTDSMEEA